MSATDDIFAILKRRDAIIDNTLARLDRAYSRLKDKLEEYVSNERLTQAIDVAAARKDVERILLASGIYDVVGDDSQYADYLQYAKDIYKRAYGENFEYKKISLEEMNILKDMQFDKFNRLTEAGRDLLADSVVNLRLGAATFESARAELTALVDSGLARYVNTWIETAQSAFSSMASTKLASDNGIEKFEYVGVIDNITRPFCLEHIGEIKTIAEWDDLDNGQINPVSIYRGGYNCRHVLIGVPAGFEKPIDTPDDRTKKPTEEPIPKSIGGE
jgi:hypothetical protein